MKKTIIQTFKTHGREPVIRKMPDGTIVCLALSGGQNEPDNKNVVTVAKSLDGGESFTEPEVLFSHQSRGCWCTEIFTEAERPFAVVHTYNAQSWYRELRTFISYYENGVWSEPVGIKGSADGCSFRQGIKMSNGEWLWPVYWQETREGGFSKDYDFSKARDFDFKKHPFICGAAICSDKEHFNRYGYIDADCALWEPNCVETEDGHIIMYCRSNKGFLYMSESFDYGRSWSKASLTDIKNPDTKVTLLKANGTVLMLNNLSQGGWDNRKNLSVLKSKDGKNFEKIANIEDEETWVCYPHAFIDNGTLYVAYDDCKTHYLKRFDLEELGI